MFRRLRNAYDVLIGSLLDYAKTIQQIDRQVRDLHGLDVPTVPATDPTPALSASTGERPEGPEEAVRNGTADRPARRRGK